MISLLRKVVGLAVVPALVSAACGSDDAREPAAESAAESPTAAALAEEGAFDVEEFVAALAADDLMGRQEETPESEASRELILAEISDIADPVVPEAGGELSYLQPYDGGTNVLAIIPGDDLAGEYVLIGAHYDHHGTLGSEDTDCVGDPDDADDEICNGATDNATGVAAVISLANSIAAEGPPRRSVVLGFWDEEEDGLIGAEMYLADPVVPLEGTVAYINFDIQGANLTPALANATIMVGAETGGPNLVESAASATAASSLDTVALSLLFGQGRSDHAPFAAAEVPVVFFTDANTGCYHTVKDDIDVVDFAKLDQQILTAETLAVDLVATDTPPEFDAEAPPSTYADAAELLRIVSAAEPDFDLFAAEHRATIEQFLIDLRGIVDAGQEAFDDEANETVLGGALEIVTALSETDCDPYLD